MVLGVFLAPWWQRISWLMIQAGCKGKCNPGKSCGMLAGSSIHSSRDLPPTQKADHSESSRVEEPGKGADQTANTQFRVPACKQDSTSSSYHPTSNDKVPNMAKFKKKSACLLRCPHRIHHQSARRSSHQQPRPRFKASASGDRRQWITLGIWDLDRYWMFKRHDMTFIHLIVSCFTCFSISTCSWGLGPQIPYSPAVSTPAAETAVGHWPKRPQHQNATGPPEKRWKSGWKVCNKWQEWPGFDASFKS